MKLSESMFGLLLFSPYIYTICHVLSMFVQVDYFLLTSFFSLIALHLSKYSSIILLSFILIPSLASFGIFLLGDPLPLIGLAAGYLLAFPSFMLLSSYQEKKIENLVLTYLFALAFNVWILYSSDKVFLTSKDLFANLMFGLPEKFIVGEQFTLSQSVNGVFTSLTAASCTSLFFIISRKSDPEFPRGMKEITPLISSSIIILLLAFVTRVWIYGSLVASLSVFLIILGLSLILRIVK